MASSRFSNVTQYLFCLSLMLFCGHSLAAEKASKANPVTETAKVLKTVNGVAISQEQLNHFLQNLQAQGQ